MKLNVYFSVFNLQNANKTAKNKYTQICAHTKTEIFSFSSCMPVKNFGITTTLDLNSNCKFGDPTFLEIKNTEISTLFSQKSLGKFPGKLVTQKLKF